MLPVARVNGTPTASTSKRNHQLATYLRRLTKPNQMDFEYTFWLMLQLCYSPKTAYRHSTYNKQTKNYWARDDPAFVVVCCQLVALAAVAYSFMFSKSWWQALRMVFSAVFVHFLLVGAVVATIGWYITNRWLLKKQTGGSDMPQQRVEWMYAFDVHCNAYLPLFLLLYLVQLVLSPLLLMHSFVTAALSNMLYTLSLSYYHYLIFLGFSSLPFLEHTEVFLAPAGVILLLWPLVTFTGFNPTRFVLGLYFGVH